MPAHRRDHSLGLVPASVEDYRELARRRLPRQIFDYIDGGSFAKRTLAANRDDLRHIQLRQRVLRDVSQHRLSTTVLGQEFAEGTNGVRRCGRSHLLTVAKGSIG